MAAIDTIPPLIAIVGETASGKTAAAIEIAKKVDGEIICADSRTVYKQMNIGTAKPIKAEQASITHHLLDIVEPDENFNVAQFKVLAQKCIRDIAKRGKVPILVGGTGLYIDSVLYDYQLSQAPDLAMREQLEQMSDGELTTVLQTKNIDISRLNTKNRRHVIRAIERGGAAPNNTTLRPNTFVAAISTDRETLRKRITQRVDDMFAAGFLDEARQLFDRYPETTESLQTPGYKAAYRYLSGDFDISEAKNAFIQADMQLAKRQRTWFKRNKHIRWYEQPEDLIAATVEFIDHFNYNTK